MHIYVCMYNQLERRGKLMYVQMVPFKDNIKEKHSQSHVVYKFTCETCKQSYIGKTKRILLLRVKEHLNPKKESAIQTHLKEHPTHVFKAENIEILDKATSDFKLRLKEELHIVTHKPEINVQHAAAYKIKHNKDMFKSNMKTLIISQSS